MGLSPNLMKHLYEEHGKDVSRWPSELQDLINPKIEARNIAPPISGKVDTFLNTDYHYHWVEFVDGATPKHDRAESLKYAGWEFATTDDVKMCSDDAVKGRSKDRKSKDGKGWSDDIRSGDRRLMKIPMHLWRQTKKAQNLAAYQMAYPQPFGSDGKPMSAQNLIPGFKTETMDEAEIADSQRKFNSSNSVQQKTHKQIQEEAGL
jgi:hypothetical protein